MYTFKLNKMIYLLCIKNENKNKVYVFKIVK